MSTEPTVAHGAVPFRVSVPYTVEWPAGAPPADGWPWVLALHGMGMRASTFAHQVRPALPPGVGLAVPRAPMPYEVVRGDQQRRIRHAWYAYEGDSPEFRRRLHHSADLVADLRRAIVAGRPLDPGRAVLLGFSQGAYLAGVAGLRDRGRWCGLAVCAGRVKTEMLAEAWAGAAGLPVLCCGGAEDPALPPALLTAVVAELQGHGVQAEARVVPGGHRFGAPMAAAVRDWLGGVLGA